MDHGLVQEVLGDLSLAQARRPVQVEAAPHVLTTDIDATLSHLPRPLGSEQLRRIVPLPLVAVETIRIL